MVRPRAVWGTRGARCVRRRIDVPATAARCVLGWMQVPSTAARCVWGRMQVPSTAARCVSGWMQVPSTAARCVSGWIHVPESGPRCGFRGFDAMRCEVGFVKRWALVRSARTWAHCASARVDGVDGFVAALFVLDGCVATRVRYRRGAVARRLVVYGPGNGCPVGRATGAARGSSLAVFVTASLTNRAG